MDTQTGLAISAAVVALTQFVKWSGRVSDSQGPIVVVALSLVGVLFWAISKEPVFARALIWDYFVTWISVLLQAAGIYGFTRSVPAAVSSFTRPPEGVAQQPTGKMA